MGAGMIRPEGSWVAIVTPLTEDGEVDYAGFEQIVDFQAASGTSGLLLMGSTGEPTALSLEERRQIIDRVVPYCNGRLPVFVGTTCGSTRETVQLSRYAANRGADGLVLVAPPYVGPTQEGLYRHFKAVAEAVDVAVALYNNPSRVSVNIEPSTVVRLAAIPNIVADKEAMPNLSQVVEIMRAMGRQFSMLCCDYPGYGLIIPVLALGGRGTANVAGNIIPREMAQLSRPWRSYEDMLVARELYFRLIPLLQALYSVVNPVAVKGAMNHLGLPAGPVRLPLLDMEGEKLDTLKRILDSLEIGERDRTVAAH